MSNKIEAIAGVVLVGFGFTSLILTLLFVVSGYAGSTVTLTIPGGTSADMPLLHLEFGTIIMEIGMILGGLLLIVAAAKQK